jgi:hypothetical protein
MSALAQIAQDDFSVGTLRGTAPDVQPGVGVHRILNGFISDDGDVYLRGPSKYYSNAAVSEPLTWLWSGVLGSLSVVLFTTATKLYSLDPAHAPVLVQDGAGLPAPVLPAVVNDTLYLPNLRAYSSAGTVATWTPPAGLPAGPLHLAAIADRLVVAAGNRVAFSAAGTPTTFAATDYHELPGGTVITGLFAIEDTLLVFTVHGLWAITNMAYDLTDAAGNVQQTLSLRSPDLSLGYEAGLCGWQGRVVAPCTDRVCLVDTVNAPVTISNSIAPMYAEMMAANQRPGGAKVFRDTLFLPIIGATSETLTCRLNRPVQGRQLYYPWTEMNGHAGLNAAYDFFIATTGPTLLGAGNDGRVNDIGGVIDITGAPIVGLDADGVAAEFQIETRDLPTGRGQPNHLKRIRVHYTGKKASGSQFAIMDYSVDPLHETWRGDLPMQQMPMPGVDPIAWWLPAAVRARYARARLTVVGGHLSSLTVHRIELQARGATHAR